MRCRSIAARDESMMMLHAAASWLFVPGDRPERFAKAFASGAHVVVIDLEDAVAPAAKDGAREMLRRWAHPDRTVVLRINGADTPWFDADLAIAGLPGVIAVMLPKAESAQTLTRVRAAGARALVPLVETASGFAAIDEVACAEGVARVAFGSIDLRVDLEMGDAREDDLLFFRSRLVLASRLAAIGAPVDGVTVHFEDAALLADDVHRARRLGFGGKLCVHPRQVDAVNQGFAPSQAEIDWARRIIAAAAPAGGSAVSLDGAMIDRPTVLRARSVLARALPRYDPHA